MNSYQPKALLNDLQYYITPPHDCSYLPNKSARMVFLDPAHRIDVVTLSELSRTGFRRSGGRRNRRGNRRGLRRSRGCYQRARNNEHQAEIRG